MHYDVIDTANSMILTELYFQNLVIYLFIYVFVSASRKFGHVKT